MYGQGRGKTLTEFRKERPEHLDSSEKWGGCPVWSSHANNSYSMPMMRSLTSSNPSERSHPHLKTNLTVTLLILPALVPAKLHLWPRIQPPRSTQASPPGHPFPPPEPTSVHQFHATMFSSTLCSRLPPESACPQGILSGCHFAVWSLLMWPV